MDKDKKKTAKIEKITNNGFTWIYIQNPSMETIVDVLDSYKNKIYT